MTRLHQVHSVQRTVALEPGHGGPMLLPQALPLTQGRCFRRACSMDRTQASKATFTALPRRFHLLLLHSYRHSLNRRLLCHCNGATRLLRSRPMNRRARYHQHLRIHPTLDYRAKHSSHMYKYSSITCSQSCLSSTGRSTLTHRSTTTGTG